LRDAFGVDQAGHRAEAARGRVRRTQFDLDLAEMAGGVLVLRHGMSWPSSVNRRCCCRRCWALDASRLDAPLAAAPDLSGDRVPDASRLDD
jgi:hypothetical protein